MCRGARRICRAVGGVREDGYGRRYTLLYLLHAQHDPAAMSALAEARIREVGQWYFWCELRAVAKEIVAPDPGEITQKGGANGVS